MGEFDVVFSALNYNYSWKLYAARRIRAENEDVLTEEAHHAFDELINALELFGPAREHFKTLYFQWALIEISRTMLYASIPVLLTAVAGVVYLEPGLFPGTVLGVRLLPKIIVTERRIYARKYLQVSRAKPVSTHCGIGVTAVWWFERTSSLVITKGARAFRTTQRSVHLFDESTG
ncbi:MAG: hypothetical protein ACI8VE_001932 [Natrialbaceae archaeon]